MNAKNRRPVWPSTVIGTVLLFCICAPGQDATSVPAADVVLVHAKIYTVNERQSWAEALAIRGGTILAVGREADVAKYRGPHTKVIDAQGRLVLPGFTDCHIHFLDGSLSLLQVNLDRATTVGDIQRQVKAYASAHPELPWVLGRGWQYTVFGGSGLPNKAILDEVIPDRPVYLESFDGHTWWANSKALKLAGITRESKDPAGRTGCRARSGQWRASWNSKEDAADAVVRRAAPQPSHQQKLEALRRGMHEANVVGLIGAISPGGVSVEGGDFTALDLYDKLRHQGQLTLRLYIASRLEPPVASEDQMEKIAAARRRFHDEWIAAGAAKFFLDGVIESHTAAMLAPYSNDPERSGSLLWEPEKYKQAVAELDRRGISDPHAHAIGDKTVRLALGRLRRKRRRRTTRAMPVPASNISRTLARLIFRASAALA